MAFASSEVAEVIEAEPLDVADGVEGMAIGCSIWNKHKYLVYMILIKNMIFFHSSIQKLLSFFLNTSIHERNFAIKIFLLNL